MRAGSEARSTVEVAHEALIQRWPTLREWVRANRQKMRARAAILRAKTEWEENGGSEKFLLDPGVHLERGRAFSMDPGDVRGRQYPRLCQPLDREGRARSTRSGNRPRRSEAIADRGATAQVASRIGHSLAGRGGGGLAIFQRTEADAKAQTEHDEPSRKIAAGKLRTTDALVQRDCACGEQLTAKAKPD